MIRSVGGSRRVWGRFVSGALTVQERTRFVWDGDTLVHEIRSRATAAGDPVVEERTFAFEDRSFVPWAQCDDRPDGFGGRRRAWSFFVNDPIGTPDELVGGDGEVLTELDRQAWGRTEAVEGARTATPLRFQGQQEDAETGLAYNRLRYYDADAGLYISPDPIGLDGGLRPFGYVPNPIGWVDPLGLAPLPRYHGPKPRYHVNPAHDTRFLCYNRNKTPLPDDAEEVYRRAVPDDAANANHWYGTNAQGEIYRFSNANDGTAHFSGRERWGDGIRNIGEYPRKRLGR
jgi:RHS repeat-associated protein